MAHGVASTSASSRIDLLSTVRPRVGVWSAAATALGSLAVVAALATADGGYWPTSWGWTALALSWGAALGLILGTDRRVSRFEVIALAGFAGFLVWVLFSNLWTSSQTRTMLEAERAAVYVAAFAAVVALVRSRSYRALLVGIWGAIALVSIYSLASRLFPERVGELDALGGYRLSEPIGYWNALGLFAVLGALLALGLAARARSLPLRGLAAASLLVVVPTLYFTFSRGAWVALAAGLAAALALDPRRLQLVAAVPFIASWPALAVWIASRSEPLTTVGSSLEDTSAQGRRLAVIILLVGAAASASALTFAAGERRIHPTRTVRFSFGILLVLVLAVALGTLLLRAGSPSQLARDAWHDFTVPPAQSADSTDLNERLLRLYGSGRDVQWEVALDQFRAHPWLGGGAGTYEQEWILHRPVPSKVRDAHSLYVETLGELGPLGVGMLAIALGVPMLAAIKARRRSLVPVAFGAYVAFLVHAAVDWDWELPAVTLAALLCAAAILVAARPLGATWLLSTRVRVASFAAVSGLAAFVVVGLVGNSALAATKSALGDGNWTKVEAQARKAERWAPWSSDPPQWLGLAELFQGRRKAARTHLLEAVEKDPRSWELWFNLASASEGRERARAWAKVKDLNPFGGGREPRG
jgi:O-antigen ligase/polysaccharide polymerase Wzy-like membrane protein